MSANLRSFSLGFAAIIAISVVAFLSLVKGFDNGFVFVWISMAVGGFITARFAASRKLLLAAALAVPTAVGMALFNWLWDRFGFGSDFAGFGGSLIVLLFTLPIAAVLCLVGGGVGLLLSRWLTPNTSFERTREG